MQTDSEKDVHKGVQDILRGIYTSIRNPRSHDSIPDNKLESDAIIVFINYLLNIIDRSKLSFEENDFLKRVFDEYYVKTAEYSDLLVLEIPARQRANIAVNTVLRRDEGDIYALAFFLTSLFSKLDAMELSRVYKIISDELKFTTADKDIRMLLHICPGIYWDKIDKAVRLRIESILLNDFESCAYNASTEEIGEKGALATWIINDHLKKFKNLNDWTRIAVNKLDSENDNQIAYLDRYLWSAICSANKDSINYSLKYYFSKGLKDKNPLVVERFEGIVTWQEDHPWWKVFEEELKLHPDIKYIDFPW